MSTAKTARSSKIKNLVKKRANGYCEACDKKITLMGKNGEPLLIPHHIIQLSDGGEDSEENVAAVCSRCHDRIHYGEDGDDYNILVQKKIAKKQQRILEERCRNHERKIHRMRSHKRHHDLIELREDKKIQKDERLLELTKQMKDAFLFRKRFNPF